MQRIMTLTMYSWQYKVYVNMSVLVNNDVQHIYTTIDLNELIILLGYY